MGKYEAKNAKRKKKRKARRSGGKNVVLVLAILILAAALTLFVMPQVLYQLRGEEAAQNTETQLPAEDGTIPLPENRVQFPVILEEGSIQVESLFQFEGVNPDADNQEAEDTAAIVLKNMSDRYLRQAEVTAVLADGTERSFAVTELPAGAAAIAFATDNASLPTADLCTDITAQTVFEDTPRQDGISVFVDGMTVTVTNTSAEDMNGMDVYYRDVFDDKYFGGKTYSCHIEHLSAGESTTFTAGESLLGVIEVVRVAVNNMN